MSNIRLGVAGAQGCVNYVLDVGAEPEAVNEMVLQLSFEGGFPWGSNRAFGRVLSAPDNFFRIRQEGPSTIGMDYTVHFTIDFDEALYSTSIKAFESKTQEPALEVQPATQPLYHTGDGNEPVPAIEEQPGEIQNIPEIQSIPEHTLPVEPTHFCERSTYSDGAGYDRFHLSTYDRHYDVNLPNMISTIAGFGMHVAALHITTSAYRTKVYLACCRDQKVVEMEIRFYQDFSAKWETIGRFLSTSQTLLERKARSPSSLGSDMEEAVLGDMSAQPCEIWASGNVCCNSSGSSSVLLTEANAAIRKSLNLSIA
ncbi:hypothetical protein BU16DRAFT_556899 [Lophium mytilinum]|uniref:Uncharacterized protein n=1 Tax=Lophium mytilinum TaxID=390894 RepID=A0A6A6R7S7_9PEZI|nr:hypothetical protein BU16DRAFT_556899 [Lophium mytilinum]